MKKYISLAVASIALAANAQAVMTYTASDWDSSSNHGVWLQSNPLKDFGGNQYFSLDDGAVFTAFDDGTAALSGNVTNSKNSALTFALELKFDKKKSLTDSGG